MTAISKRALLGCIADDFTGATDLANMLVRGGMRTTQCIGVPTVDETPDQASNPAPPDRFDADALVVALKSRTLPAADAVAQSLAALDWLRAQGCRQFLFKYCSTFDSTDAGNIGPVTDALLDALFAEGEERNGSHGTHAFTIACPAFPENGRTIFRGHLFVGDALLNASGMENHPLTPMRDANLVNVLQRQTRSKVGLVRYDTVADGVAAVSDAFAALRGQGVRMAIADAVSDADLYTLGAACADFALITGGSGIALGLPDNFRAAGLLDDHADAARLPRVEGLSAVLAGSASKATHAQVAAWRETRPAFRIDPLAAARGEAVVEQALAFAQPYLDQAEPVLIYATATPDEVKAVQRELGVDAAGHLVESTLASIARGLRERGVRKFVVAGGETSGAVVQALAVRTLRIGAQIDPGVPATATGGDEPLALALKSGNFGSTDFFEKALRHLDQLEHAAHPEQSGSHDGATR
ncbi:four-carbon acid sugar kinase family protein [Paraburkholderia sp. D15]|uniref:3-oxo-tetronate kinase n=1 Tax=Paraburkholderia sp. D15 TaxID=2880218 RepID=UPI0024784E2B|nr:3-oxo-tetronate kinase [Paraburkholderia sp. D15]WGS53881.1 four-carbon acid sugar kinase family protein [Paraburkholderia sp. D15]